MSPLWHGSLRLGVRRLVAALDGRIHSPAMNRDSTSPEGEMNFALEGGDESPHSKSSIASKISSRDFATR
jgi:hypothetical protein